MLKGSVAAFGNGASFNIPLFLLVSEAVEDCDLGASATVGIACLCP